MDANAAIWAVCLSAMTIPFAPLLLRGVAVSRLLDRLERAERHLDELPEAGDPANSEHVERLRKTLRRLGEFVPLIVAGRADLFEGLTPPEVVSAGKSTNAPLYPDWLTPVAVEVVAVGFYSDFFGHPFRKSSLPSLLCAILLPSSLWMIQALLVVLVRAVARQATIHGKQADGFLHRLAH